jgi:UrcA family protein
MFGPRKMLPMGAAIIVGVLSGGAATTPVNAQAHSSPVTVVAPRSESLTRIVPYGDLSLATKAGRRVLFHRVSIAVREVCPILDTDGTPLNSDSCMDFAWAGARPQMKRAFEAAISGAPVLTAIEITSTLGR